MKKPIVINLFGAPGAGKSTTAAGLFALMKLKKYKVELVTGHAKDLTYSESFKELSNQLKVFGEQNYRMHRLVGSVDFIVTDSPLLNSLVYGDETSDNFKGLVVEKYNEYQNFDVFLHRVKEYAPYGRTQSVHESDLLGYKIINILKEQSPIYQSVDGDADAPKNILSLLECYLNGYASDDETKYPEDVTSILLAEAQLLGYTYRFEGYSVEHLVNDMGLTADEWVKIKNSYTAHSLNASIVDTIDAYMEDK